MHITNFTAFVSLDLKNVLKNGFTSNQGPSKITVPSKLQFKSAVCHYSAKTVKKLHVPGLGESAEL